MLSRPLCKEFVQESPVRAGLRAGGVARPGKACRELEGLNLGLDESREREHQETDAERRRREGWTHSLGEIGSVEDGRAEHVDRKDEHDRRLRRNRPIPAGGGAGDESPSEVGEADLDLKVVPRALSPAHAEGVGAMEDRVASKRNEPHHAHGQEERQARRALLGNADPMKPDADADTTDEVRHEHER